MGILKSILEYIGGAETASAAKLSVDGKCGKSTVKALQKYLGVTQDGIISGQNSALKKYHPALTAVKYGKGGSATVRSMQKWLGITQDGQWGRNTSVALQKKLGVAQDGIAGANTIKALQKFLNSKTPTPAPAPKPAPAPAPTPTPAPKATTNADKVVAVARSLAGTSKKPTAAYKSALKKAYPSKKGWGSAAKKGKSCDVFVGTVLRTSGLSSSCPRGLKDMYNFKPTNFNRYVFHNVKPSSVSKYGDVVIYKKKGGGGHACIRSANGIYQANNPRLYPHYTSGFSKLSTKRPTVIVWRAK